MPQFFRADWPAPPRVRTLVTTRNGGVSAPPYGDGQGGSRGWNLGARVGDKPEYVEENRHLLARSIGHTPVYLHQVHGTAVADLDAAPAAGEPVADAGVATRPGRVCIVLVADCLPVLLCDRAGTVVAAAHCGWRGLAGGVLEQTVAAMRRKAGDATLLAWLGPAIGPAHFEVGAEVREAFAGCAPADDVAFTAAAPGKYRADLFELARRRLARLGVAEVAGGGDCTYAQPQRYYSHRRATHEGRVTGRMAAAVWLQD
jgi:YfiH family protein